MNTFDFSKVKQFDKHIEQSIPNYTGLVEVGMTFARYFLGGPNTTLVDLGCSTGSFLTEATNDTECKAIGCDPVKMEHVSSTFEFHQMSAKELLASSILRDTPPNMISAMFTLQFMSKYERKATISALKPWVRDGSALFVAEKVIMDNALCDNLLYRRHLREKLKHFTAAELAEKEEQLTLSMKPQTESSVISELRELGEPCQVWQSYNFKAWMIV